EDGIRDYKVTGVQTCALPISRVPRQPLADIRARSPGRGESARLARPWRTRMRFSPRIGMMSAIVAIATRPIDSTRKSRRCGDARSEERRGGKGGRSGWRADA